MSVPAGYLGLIAIWSTTPLGIQWSAEGGFLYGVTARMVLGTFVAAIVMRLWGVSLHWHRKARGIYLISGLSIFLSMVAIYWASQHIPSGWISVIFGLMPIFTAILASIFLHENSLAPEKLFGMLLGFAGLALVFVSGQEMGGMAVWGILAILFGTFLQAAATVWLKYIQHDLAGLEINLGGLLVAVPCFIAAGLVADIDWTPELSGRGIGAILYLAVIGSALGYTLYFFVLKHVSATRVSLIALITPVCTLLLGSWLNNEPVVASVWVGTGLIGLGLLSFELRSGRSWLRRKLA